MDLYIWIYTYKIIDVYVQLATFNIVSRGLIVKYVLFILINILKEIICPSWSKNSNKSKDKYYFFLYI